MTQAPPAKFLFDTVFDNGAVVPASRAKRHFTAEDLEQARAEGRAEGERSAVALAEADMAATLDDISGTLRQAIGALAALAHEHRRASADLSLACARRIADAALDQFPHAPVEAALGALAQELAAGTMSHLSESAGVKLNGEGSLAPWVKPLPAPQRKWSTEYRPDDE
jgi:flagellar assembly protein FliH